MAVRANNIRNARSAQSWSEKDDAALCVLLKRKIRDTSIAIRESTTPYERARLKQQKAQYVSMLHKVEKGAYNGDIIYHELRAAAALSQEAALASGVNATMRGGKKYANSYGNVDFDYESAFRKKRYYGFFLPLLMTLLTIVMIASTLLGALIPSVIPAEPFSSIENVLNFNSMFVYRLGNYEGGNFDIGVKADENGKWWWPEGNYDKTKITLVQGEPWTDRKGKVHDDEGEVIYLHDDLGFTEIYIDSADIIKAWFGTKMLEKTRLDFIEDLPIFQGESYYYALYLAGTKADELIIAPDEEGNYDFGVIYNHLGVYGTIIFLLLTIILMIILLIQNVVRLFTYTSRRIHVTTLLCFLSSLLTFICPVLASCEGTDIGSAFSNYMLRFTNAVAFTESTVTSIGMTLLPLIPVIVSFIMLILPLFFKNRIKNMPSRIPRGNKVHV